MCNFLLVINCNLGLISHSFWDMASFPLKSAHFSYHFLLSPTFKTVSFALDR